MNSSEPLANVPMIVGWGVTGGPLPWWRDAPRRDHDGLIPLRDRRVGRAPLLS
jgi:hypothetical protein